MTTASVKKGTTITSALKKQAIVLNKEMLQATSELIDNSVKSAEKWQGLTERVLNAGTKMLGKQQDLTLIALEVAAHRVAKAGKTIGKMMARKAKAVKHSADEMIESVEAKIESDLTIDEVMATTVAKVEKTVKSVKAATVATVAKVEKAVKAAQPKKTTAAKPEVVKAIEKAATTIDEVMEATVATIETAAKSKKTVPNKKTETPIV